MGYTSVTLGVPLDLLGVLEMGAREPDCSLLSTADCFELVCLPIWLIAKGFSALPFAEELRSPGLVTSG